VVSTSPLQVKADGCPDAREWQIIAKKDQAKRYMTSEELVEALAAMSELDDRAPSPKTGCGGGCGCIGKEAEEADAEPGRKGDCEPRRAMIHVELIETVLLMKDSEESDDSSEESEAEEETQPLKRTRDRKCTGFVTKADAVAATRQVDFEDEEEEEEEQESRARRRRGTGFVTKAQAAAVAAQFGEEISEEEDGSCRSDAQEQEKRKEQDERRAAGPKEAAKTNTAKCVVFEGKAEDDHGKDGVEWRRSKGRRGTGFVTKEVAAKAMRELAFETSDEEGEEASVKKEQRTTGRKGTAFVSKEEAAKAAKQVSFEEAADDEADDDAAKKRRTKGRRGTAFVTKEEKERAIRQIAMEDTTDDDGGSDDAKSQATNANRRVNFEEGEDYRTRMQGPRPKSRRKGTSFVTKEAAAAMRPAAADEEEEEEEEEQKEAEKATTRPRARSREGGGAAFITEDQVAAASRLVRFTSAPSVREFATSKSLGATERPKEGDESGDEGAAGGRKRVRGRKGTGVVTKEQLLALLDEDGDDQECASSERPTRVVSKASLQRALSKLQSMESTETQPPPAAEEPAGEGQLMTSSKRDQATKGDAAVAVAGSPTIAQNAALAARERRPETVETVRQGCGCKPGGWVRKVFGKR
jgi:hypothetical protein